VYLVYCAGYELDDQVFNTWKGQEVLLISEMYKPVLALTSLQFNGVLGFFHQDKVDHLPPPSTKVKSEWSYTSTLIDYW